LQRVWAVEAKRGEAPSYITNSPLVIKGRRIKGMGLINRFFSKKCSYPQQAKLLENLISEKASVIPIGSMWILPYVDKSPT